MASADKPLIWLEGEIKTPPFSQTARLEAGYLLRKLQQGEMLGMPHSRPVNDESATWRIIYRLDTDAIVILEVFSKKSRVTPNAVINACKKRLKDYENA